MSNFIFKAEHRKPGNGLNVEDFKERNFEYDPVVHPQETSSEESVTSKPKPPDIKPKDALQKNHFSEESEVVYSHNIIRLAGEAARDPRELYKEAIQRAKKDAQKILQDASQQAQQNAMEIEQDAYHKGFEAGERAGLEIGHKKMEALLNDFVSIVKQLSESYRDIVRKNEKSIYDLAILIAEKIIHQQLTTDPQTILRLCSETMQKAIKNEKIILKVSSFDLEHVLRNREMFNIIVNMENLTITDDATITRGGCLVITESGSVDGRVETQLERIKDQISKSTEGVE